MPGLSVHVVDTSRGQPATGMRIEIYDLISDRKLIAEGVLERTGALDHPIAQQRLAAGSYEVVFHAGAFFTSAGAPQSDPPFLDLVPFRFQISDPEQHYHLPMKMTPWGFSVYRGS